MAPDRSASSRRDMIGVLFFIIITARICRTQDM
jgi:hypothetical protein